MIETEYFIVKEGKAVPMPEADLGDGRITPTGSQVLLIPKTGWFGKERRIALYPVNSPTPFPLGDPVALTPDSFGVSDLKNLMGPYISSLVRRALGLEDESAFKTKDWIILAITGAGTATSIGTLYLAYKLANRFGLI